MVMGAEQEAVQQRNSSKLVEAMEREGYLPTAKANLELTDALEKIKVSCRLSCCLNSSMHIAAL